MNYLINPPEAPMASIKNYLRLSWLEFIFDDLNSIGITLPSSSIGNNPELSAKEGNPKELTRKGFLIQYHSSKIIRSDNGLEKTF